MLKTIVITVAFALLPAACADAGSEGSCVGSNGQEVPCGAVLSGRGGSQGDNTLGDSGYAADAWGAGGVDAGAGDAAGGAQDGLAGGADAVMDASLADGVLVDMGGAEAGGVDVWPAEAAGQDAGYSYDAGGIDGSVPDVVPYDAGGYDAPVYDSASFDSAGYDYVGYDASWQDGATVPVDVVKSDTWNVDAKQDGGFDAFPPDADVYGGTKASCLEIFWCLSESVSECANGSTACIDNCKADASLWAKSLWAPLEPCLMEKCVPKCANSQDPNCMGDCLGGECMVPALACASNGNSGSATCPDLFECTAKCKPGKAFCTFSCYGKGTPAAQKDLAGLYECWAKGTFCYDPIVSCYGGPGSASCSQTLTCLGGCGGDTVCAYKCIAKASAVADEKLKAINTCQAAKCAYCKTDQACTDACTGKSCSTEMVTCYMD